MPVLIRSFIVLGLMASLRVLGCAAEGCLKTEPSSFGGNTSSASSSSATPSPSLSTSQDNSNYSPAGAALNSSTPIRLPTAMPPDKRGFVDFAKIEAGSNEFQTVGRALHRKAPAASPAARQEAQASASSSESGSVGADGVVRLPTVIANRERGVREARMPRTISDGGNE